MKPSFLTVLCLILAKAGSIVSQTTASCTLQVNSALDEADRQPITGGIQFSQDAPGGSVDIVLDVSGFTVPNSAHGFHVHVTSDFSDGCDSTGGHFNPAGVNHGAPGDAVRHVGDLGNIVADGAGAVSANITDNVIDFTGTNDISGRAIVIHRDADDLGLGGYNDSLTTGHAGPRLACCTITVNTAVTKVHSVIHIILSLIVFKTVCHVSSS